MTFKVWGMNGKPEAQVYKLAMNELANDIAPHRQGTPFTV